MNIQRLTVCFMLVLGLALGCNNSEVEWKPSKPEAPISLPGGISQQSNAGRTYIYWEQLCQKVDGLRNVHFQIRVNNTADFEAQRDEYLRVANEIDAVPVKIGVDPDAAVISKKLSTYLRAQGEYIYWFVSAQASVERTLDGFKGPSALGELDRRKLQEIRDQRQSLVENLERTRATLQTRYREELCLPGLPSPENVPK